MDPSKKWVTADDLARFSRYAQAPQKLPLFVQWLVEASGARFSRKRILSEESANVHGLDGFVVAEDDKGEPYFPKGATVFEFGISTTHGKASKDSLGAKKKVKQEGFDPKNVTLIVVSLNKWPKKNSWLEKERKKRAWREVRAYNAIDLADWLDAKRAVALRVAKELEIIPDGVEGVDSFWEDWQSLSSPSVTPEILLAGRQKETNDFLTDLVGEAKMHVLRASSPREALAFAAAAIKTADEPVRGQLLSRMLIAENEMIAKGLSGQTGLVIGIRDFRSPVPSTLVRRGNHLIVPIGGDFPGVQPTITLGRSPRVDFVNALVGSGFERTEAERLAVESGANALLLQRTLLLNQKTASGIIPAPTWANGYASYLVPAMLAGGWDDSVEADRVQMSELSGMPYEQFETGLQPLLTIAEPPVLRIDSVWKVSAPTYCFHEIARAVTSSMLARFAKCVRGVLSEVDGRYRLKPEERAYKGAQLANSEWLRNGLAETLLLIAARGSSAGLHCGKDCQSFVSELVESIPGLSNDWRVIASLRHQSTLLAEAAPSPLLNALEQLLEGTGDAIRPIFSESEGISSDSPHTGVLWALELLGVYPEHLSRVASILAKLVKIDPGGRLANRPLRSLSGFFLYWFPKTNANFAQRMAVLDNTINNFPDVAWPLLMQLVPNQTTSTSNPPRPRWHDAGESAREGFTRKIEYDAAIGIIDRTIDIVGENVERWKDLLQKFYHFSPKQRERIYQMLERLGAKLGQEADRIAVWDAARKVVQHHESFAKAEWALPENERVRLSHIVDGLIPPDPVARHAWLFNEHFYRPAGKDFKETEKEGEKLRADAVKEIFDSKGLAGIRALLETVRYPGLVGHATADIFGDVDLVGNVVSEALADELPQMSVFLGALSARARQRFSGWPEYLRRCFVNRTLRADDIAALLQFWDEDRNTWDFAASLGEEVDDAYWRTKPVALVRGDIADLVFALTKLLASDRFVEALSSCVLRISDVPTAIIYELLEGVLRKPDLDRVAPNMLSYYVTEALKTLADRTDADDERTARIEVGFFSLIRFDQKGLVFYRLMSRSPNLFIDLVKSVYKPDTGPEEKISEKEREFATHAYGILHDWHLVPGTQADGKIDPTQLHDWIANARDLAKEVRRTKMVEYQIGKVLAHAKDDEDGNWPPVAIREVLERFSTPDLERGIEIEDFNKRGVHSRALFEGGQQEREFAAKRETWAANLEERWPKTANLLRRLAHHWQHHADEQDARARKDEFRF